MHRISVGLSQRSDKLPESIYVEGLKILDKYNLNGGAFADVYKGEFRGKEVAVKKLRVTLYQPPDQRAKTMKVGLVLPQFASEKLTILEGALPRGRYLVASRTSPCLAILRNRSHNFQWLCVYALSLDASRKCP